MDYVRNCDIIIYFKKVNKKAITHLVEKYLGCFGS